MVSKSESAKIGSGISKKVTMSELAPVLSEVIDGGGRVEFVMTGNSMLPFLHAERDVVVIEGVCAEDIKKYDALLYKRAYGKYVLHRAVNVSADSIDFCGDAQYTVEKNVPKAAVIGRLCAYYSSEKPNRVISCKKKSHRIATALWCTSRPIRCFLFRVKRKLKSIIR